METQRTENESAVLAVLDRVYSAWEINDARAFVAPYASDATASVPGAFLSGREAIRTAMSAAFAGPLKGSRAIHEIQAVRFLGEHVAIVASKGAVIMAGQAQPAPQTRALDTWVLGKTADGNWVVEAFHNCPAEAPSAVASRA